MLLSGKDNLIYKQLKKELKKKCIMGLDAYTKDILGVMKLLNYYISKS